MFAQTCNLCCFIFKTVTKFWGSTNFRGAYDYKNDMQHVLLILSYRFWRSFFACLCTRRGRQLISCDSGICVQKAGHRHTRELCPLRARVRGETASVQQTGRGLRQIEPSPGAQLASGRPPPWCAGARAALPHGWRPGPGGTQPRPAPSQLSLQYFYDQQIQCDGSLILQNFRSFHILLPSILWMLIMSVLCVARFQFSGVPLKSKPYCRGMCSIFFSYKT